MKRCPQCNRFESDDTLAFCRVDGSSLLLAGSEELGTIRLDQAPVSGEVRTTLLPKAITNDAIGHTTMETVVLPKDGTRPQTRELNKPKKRTALFVVLAVGIVVALGICAYFFFRSKNNLTPIQSIAVLPFVNESGNADVDYLSDGMTETLISSLSQLPNLNVKARSSVFRYKGKATDAKSIGKELNVQAVLNGHVMQRGDQLILSLELVNAETENVIWSEQYNRKQADLVSLQTEIARDVSSKLKTKLSGADAAKLEETYTTNSEAYKLYLQGRF